MNMAPFESRSKVWYREPWPWLLMLGPAIAIIAGFVTLFLAINSNDGLVADDYYKQGLAINRTMQRDTRAREMNYRADLTLSRESRGLRVILAGAGALPDTLRLHLIHPGKSSADETVELRALGQGLYQGEYRREFTGRRHLILEDQPATWRISGEWAGSDTGRARLRPGAPQ
jgi:uncharacterized protein